MSSTHQKSLAKQDAGRLTHPQEKNQFTETDPEMTVLMNKANKDVKTPVINTFHVVNDLKENMNRMREKK